VQSYIIIRVLFDCIEGSFHSIRATLANTEFYAWAKTEKSFEELSKIVDNLAKDMNVENNELYSRRLIGNDMIDKIEVIGTIGREGW